MGARFVVRRSARSGGKCWPGGRLSASLLLGVGLLLSACDSDDQPQALLEEYRWRLHNTLDLDAPEYRADSRIESRASPALNPVPAVVPSYPGARALNIPVQPLQINLLEFLQLSGCDLQHLLGQRNSILGKVMTETQALVYHRQFLALAQECLQQRAAAGQGADALSQTLAAALRSKGADDRAVHWNATAASTEFLQLMSAAGGAFSAAELERGLARVHDQLQSLSRLLAHPGVLDSAQLEAHFQVLGSAPVAGRLLASQQQLTQVLNPLTAAARLRLAARPLCYKPQPTEPARVAQRVFLRFYIGAVQPYLSGVHRHSRQLRGDLLLLLSPYQPWPPAFQQYWDLTWSETQVTSVWSQFNAAVADHTRLWQDLLGQCGLAPGQPPPA